jgi:two-component system chemotaxis response regulator CheB
MAHAPTSSSNRQTDPAAGIELVVVGASAGGVEALGTLLDGLPRDFRPAVAIVLHIPPDRNSLLPALFAQRCALPVKEAEDKEPVRQGMVYIAPPDYHLLIEPDRTFALSRDDAVNFSRPSIDVLFESAALAYRDTLLGIVLTGASADGAAGLRTVRHAGGQAWVQHPDEASSSLMPASAIALAGADRIIGLEDMRRQLTAPGFFTSTPFRKS